MNPSPENPSLQAQENEPSESMHTALVSQGLESHSTASRIGVGVNRMLNSV